MAARSITKISRLAKYRFFKGHYLTDEEIARFWSYVDIRGENECWPWTRNRVRQYGRFAVGKRGAQVGLQCNRIALQLSKKRDLGKQFSLHTCDNPPCCNPKHLYSGNPLQNAADMVTRGRAPMHKLFLTHCPSGHLYSDENTYRPPSRDVRCCRACLKIAKARYRAKALSSCSKSS